MKNCVASLNQEKKYMVSDDHPPLFIILSNVGETKILTRPGNDNQACPITKKSAVCQIFPQQLYFGFIAYWRESISIH